MERARSVARVTTAKVLWGFRLHRQSRRLQLQTGYSLLVYESVEIEDRPIVEDPPWTETPSQPDCHFPRLLCEVGFDVLSLAVHSLG